MERSFFFRTDDRPLYGRIYLPSGPEGGASPARRGVLICDSLFEEKFWCERVHANMARRLAAAGNIVLSFDYYGYGNSGGDSADLSVSSIIRDISCACDLLRQEGAGAISLFGVRWGALPACAVAEARDDIDSLLLVNPVTGWKKQFMKALRANVAGQYSIFKKAVMTREKIIEELLAGGDCVRSGYRMNNLEGYYISKEFFEGVSVAAMPDSLPENVRKAWVITVPEKETDGQVPVDPLARRWKEAGADCEGIVVKDNAFWINNRIFTSVTPVLFDVMDKLVGSLEGPDSSASAGTKASPVERSDSCVIGSVREEAVTVTSPEGHELCAVTYIPEGQAADEGFVFTHGGLIGMNGAFRFNTRAARRLAAAGFPSICCDTHGMGRSGGLIENQEQRVLFRGICDGLFAGDVWSASAALKDMAGVRSVTLFGVCGGAITNILSHSRYEDIDRSVLLSIPVMLPSLAYGEVRMSEGYARFYLGLYLRKIFNPKAWWRFLTGKSEMDKISKSLAVTSGGILKKLGGSKTPPVAAGRGSDTDKESGEPAGAGQVKSGLSVAVPGAGDLQFNPGFLEAYRRITGRGGRMYFVFGEHDNFKWEFNSEFRDAMPDEFAAGDGLVKIEEIVHANHMYTLREWQDDIIDRCIAWTKKPAP